MGFVNYFAYSLLGLDGLFGSFQSGLGILTVARTHADTDRILNWHWRCLWIANSESRFFVMHPFVRQVYLSQAEVRKQRDKKNPACLNGILHVGLLGIEPRLF